MIVSHALINVIYLLFLSSLVSFLILFSLNLALSPLSFSRPRVCLSPPSLSFLLSLHLSPSGGRTLGVPKQAVEHQHHLAVRPIHRRTDITRGQRETRRDGRGEDSTEAPAADGRNRASASRPASLGAEASDRGRPREQHPLRGSTRSHRRPPARSSSSSSSGARSTARPQQQQQHQQRQHQQQTATQQQHHKFARSEHHNLGRSGANSSR